LKNDDPRPPNGPDPSRRDASEEPLIPEVLDAEEREREMGGRYRAPLEGGPFGPRRVAGGRVLVYGCSPGCILTSILVSILCSVILTLLLNAIF
jgi:hypothetical protein